MPVHDAETDSRLATIRSLLAKAESTEFPEEAEAFTAKATELMSRYALDEAMVWATTPSSGAAPTELQLVVHRPFTAQKAVLVSSVASAYGCHALRLGRDERSGAERMSVVGFPSDVHLVETLVTSLFLQLTRAMTAPGAAPRGTATQVAGWRRSFIVGFTHTIAERLAASRAAAQAERAASSAEPAPASGTTSTTTRPSVDLVLRDRADLVDADFRRRYPRIRQSRVSVGTSAAGARAGSDAGRTADIGGRRLGHRAAVGPAR